MKRISSVENMKDKYFPSGIYGEKYLLPVAVMTTPLGGAGGGAAEPPGPLATCKKNIRKTYQKNNMTPTFERKVSEIYINIT